jgi:hypothetical protein
MKLDTSVAPELAAWTMPAPSAPQGAAPHTTGLTSPATVGYLAACLRILVADPQSWWDRVRFDPCGPAQVAVGAPSPGCEACLLVLPPGYRGEAPDRERNWPVACLVAGEMADQVAGPGGWRTRPLSAGRTRVRGGQGVYRMINTGNGYAVSLLARAHPAPAPAG